MQFSVKTLRLLLVLCFFLWGGGMIAMKYAFESFSVMHVIFARVAFAGVFYLLIFNKWKNLPYQKGDWKYLAAIVAFEPCLFFLFETFALKFTTAARAVLLQPVYLCVPL